MASGREITSSSTSWADESEEIEESPKTQGSAWAKPNPWTNKQAEEKQTKTNDYRAYDDYLPTLKEAASLDSRSSQRGRDERDSQPSTNNRREQRSEYAPPNRSSSSYNGYQDRPRERREDRESNFSRDRDYSDREPRGDNRREGFTPYHDDRDRDRESYNRGPGRDDRFSRGGDRRSFGRNFGERAPYRSEGREQREPREQRPREPVPLPTSPPFTAFVGNLSWDLTDRELADFFEPASQVKNVRLLFDKATGRPKGYGYVEFENLESLKIAVEKNGQILMDRELRIDVAETKPENPRKDTWGSGRRDSFAGRDRERDSSRERDELPPSEDQEPRERRKLELKPRTVETPPAAPTSASSSKSNPFGQAKPRDENLFLKKKEEERKLRETKEQEEKPEKESTPEPEKTSESPKQSEENEKPESPRRGTSQERRENNSERRSFRNDGPRDRDNRDNRDVRRRDDTKKSPREDTGYRRPDREDRPFDRDRPPRLVNRDNNDRPPRRGGFGGDRDRRPYNSYNNNRDRDRDDRRRDERDPRQPKKEPSKSTSDEVQSTNLFSALPEEDE